MHSQQKQKQTNEQNKHIEQQNKQVKQQNDILHDKQNKTHDTVNSGTNEVKHVVQQDNKQKIQTQNKVEGIQHHEKVQKGNNKQQKVNNQMQKQLLQMQFQPYLVKQAIRITGDKEKAIQYIIMCLQNQEKEKEKHMNKHNNKQTNTGNKQSQVPKHKNKNKQKQKNNKKQMPAQTIQQSQTIKNEKQQTVKVEKTQKMQQNEMRQQKNQQQESQDYQDVQQDYKMIFLVRMDLKMGLGKIAAQVAHATLKAYKQMVERANENDIDFVTLQQWKELGQKKIVVKVNSQAQLLSTLKKASEKRLNNCYIRDAGLTQIASGSLTVGAIGPGSSSQIDSITKMYKLL